MGVSEQTVTLTLFYGHLKNGFVMKNPWTMDLG